MFAVTEVTFTSVRNTTVKAIGVTTQQFINLSFMSEMSSENQEVLALESAGDW